jgi:hypothetical protein
MKHDQSIEKTTFFCLYLPFLSFELKFSFFVFHEFSFCLSRIYSEFTFLSFKFDTFIEKSWKNLIIFYRIVNYGLENSEFVVGFANFQILSYSLFLNPKFMNQTCGRRFVLRFVWWNSLIKSSISQFLVGTCMEDQNSDYAVLFLDPKLPNKSAIRFVLRWNLMKKSENK